MVIGSSTYVLRASVSTLLHHRYHANGNSGLALTSCRSQRAYMSVLYSRITVTTAKLIVIHLHTVSWIIHVSTTPSSKDHLESSTYLLKIRGYASALCSHVAVTISMIIGEVCLHPDTTRSMMLINTLLTQLANSRRDALTHCKTLVLHSVVIGIIHLRSAGNSNYVR